MSLAENLETIRNYIELSDLEKGISLLGETLKQEFIFGFNEEMIQDLRDEQLALAASISNFSQEERMGTEPEEHERNKIITRFLSVLRNIEKLAGDSKAEIQTDQKSQFQDKFEQLKDWGVDVIVAKPASEEQKSWHEYLRTSRQEEPQRLEEAAKFLAGMISITFAIILGTNSSLLQGRFPVLQVISAISWLIALFMTFFVLFPRRYRTVKESAESIQRMHEQVLRWKRRMLVGAIGAFLVGFFLLLLIYLISMLK